MKVGYVLEQKLKQNGNSMFEVFISVVTKSEIKFLGEIKYTTKAMKQETNGDSTYGQNLIVDAINCMKMKTRRRAL